jgi:RNase P subunit RPR2
MIYYIITEYVRGYIMFTAKKLSKAEFKERKAELDKEGKAYCPKCLSTDLQAGKRGFKLTTGFIGAGKTIITCLKCGNKFKPGK